MMDSYTITLNQKQLEVLMQASEVVSRLGTGQFTMALELLPFKPKCRLDYDTIQFISQRLSPLLRHEVNGYNSSLGIRNTEVAEKARIAWDLYQSFRCRLSWERAVEQGIVPSLESARKFPEMMTVDFDNPLEVSTEPLPMISKKKWNECHAQ